MILSTRDDTGRTSSAHYTCTETQVPEVRKSSDAGAANGLHRPTCYIRDDLQIRGNVELRTCCRVFSS